ncbi:hypothetical protein [Nocardioides antri]|uniref:Uncharacterized protein n=1 Tax=Nocardioides antri TaxID=2607659 RepID=A0A5B1M1T7_9ACTN|nr:hypothetical protein [Nocardioides antri]KAA1426893.1 hypothetical protein F0U47_11975 [Nocardioides antri]
MATEGVTIVRAPSAEDMNLDDALVEVIEYDDARGFLLRVCMTAEPSRLFQALELAEDLIDAPKELGPWADQVAGRWRGLAVMATATGR